MAFDEQLFLMLNFDGGALCDRIMLALSGVAMWLPLYALILWLVWRRAGWRGTLLFLLLMAAAVGLADMVAGIFKQIICDMLRLMSVRSHRDDLAAKLTVPFQDIRVRMGKGKSVL